MKKLMIGSLIIISLSCNVYASYYFDDTYNNVKNPWTEIGEDGVFDVYDGDLEDKIGDWGIYGDLFPDEVEDDYKEDYSYTKKKKDNNSDIEAKIKKQTGRIAPKKYTGKWKKESIKTEWVRRRNGNYEWEYYYEWKFYPNGSNKCLVSAWAIIDDKLYSFDENGFMIHDTKDWFLYNSDDLYAMSDGTYCHYSDYKKNKDKADTYYKNVLPKYIKVQ